MSTLGVLRSYLGDTELIIFEYTILDQLYAVQVNYPCVLCDWEVRVRLRLPCQLASADQRAEHVRVGGKVVGPDAVGEEDQGTDAVEQQAFR